MQERQNKTVYGYVRRNYNGICPNDIIKVIYSFYLLSMDSNILTDNEQISLLNLIYDKLTKTKEFKRVKSIDTELLYRASENEYRAKKFHELCNDKGATITVAHKKEGDRVFGGFTTKSWIRESDDDGEQTNDPNAFLFVIRPNVKVFRLAEHYEKDGTFAICHFSNYGPVFGTGTDFWIADRCQSRSANGSTPSTYKFKRSEFCGNHIERHFSIKDYEVFSVKTE